MEHRYRPRTLWLTDHDVNTVLSELSGQIDDIALVLFRPRCGEVRMGFPAHRIKIWRIEHDKVARLCNYSIIHKN
jgi:hypothetical protein